MLWEVLQVAMGNRKITSLTRCSDLRRRTVLHIIGQLTAGGAERQLAYIARALQSRGWRQSVVSLSSGGKWRAYLEDNSIPVYEIAPHWLKPYRLLQVQRIVRRDAPQIIVAHSLHAGVYAQSLVGVGRPQRVFMLIRDPSLDTNRARQSRELWWSLQALKRADFVISNSHWAIRQLRNHGIENRPSAVIRNIVHIRGRADPSTSHHTPRIVAVGSLKELKGYDVLLRALALIRRDSGDEFQLLVAGAGEERKNLERLTATLGLREHVSFLGEVEDVGTLLASAQLAVHASRSEGLPNAVTEAMAEGLPTVATAVGGTGEMVRNGETGFLVPPDDPEQLAKAIECLLFDPSLRARMGSAAYRLVGQTCDEEAVIDQYERVLHRLLCLSRD